MIKTSDIFQLKDILLNMLPLIFKNITGVGNKESLRHCLNQEVQEDIMAKFNVASSAAAAPAAAKSLQLCPTPCHPMDSSPPGSYIDRIFQARILEWAAISFSSGILYGTLSTKHESLNKELALLSNNVSYWFLNFKKSP